MDSNPKSDLPLAQIQDMQQKGLSNNQIIQTLQRDGYSTSQVFDALNQSNLQPAAPAMQPPMTAPPQSASNEELIEAIINEKWNDLMKDINRIIAWKDAMSDQLSKMEQKIESLKDQYDKLHEAVIGKIGEYDKNILQVGAEVKAMEKVFSKVLPVFTENVGELSRIADKLKK